MAGESTPGRPLLSVITPCTRAQNLDALGRTIPPWCQWVIVLDGPSVADVAPDVRSRPGVAIVSFRGGRYGNAQRNIGLMKATGRFVYFLDDDNIVHPGFLDEVVPLLDDHRIIVVNQVLPTGERRLVAAPPIRVGHIDTAQVVLPRSLAADSYWPGDLRQADGEYFASLWDKHATKFLFLFKDIAYYNYLRPDGGGAEVTW